jgi:hypothetical protein
VGRAHYQIHKKNILSIRNILGGERYFVFLLIVFFNLSNSICAQSFEDQRIKELYLKAFKLRNQNLDEALEYSKESLKLISQSQDLKIQSNALSVAGVLNKNKGAFKAALSYHFKCLDIREQLKDSLLISNTYSNLGATYDVSDQPVLALDFYKKCLQVLMKISATNIQLANANSNLGNIYGDLPYKFEADKKSYQDLSLHFYRKALDYLASEEDSKLKSNVYLNLGISYRDLHRLDSANYFFSHATAIQREMDDLRALSKSLHNLGLIAEEKGEIEEAKKKYREALAYADSTKNLQTKQEIIQSLMLLNIKDAPEKSFDYFNRFKLINDSLNTAKTDGELSRLRVLYEVEQKEQQNKLLQQISITQEKENQILWVILIGSGVLIITIVALFLFYRQRQLNVKLKDQNKINRMLQEQDKKYFTAIIEGQEKERKRVSQELHDRMGGLLSTVKIHLTQLGEKIDKQSISYKTTEGLLDNAIDEIRKISNDMISGILTNFGLLAATHDLATTINSANTLQITINSFGMDERLPNQVELNCFRIIQETIANGLKHAQASQMKILLHKKTAALHMSISDDGKGFDWETQKNGPGLGLKSIIRRVETLNGKLVANTTKGEGIKYTIIIPLQ